MFTTLALAAALAAPVPKAAAPDLKWKFTKGDTVYVKTVTENTSSVTGGGGVGAQAHTSLGEWVYKLTVLAAGEKETTLEMEFISAKSGSNAGGGVVAKLDDVAGVAGKKATFTLDKDHKVTKAEGADKLANAAAGVAAGLMGEDYLKHTLEDLVRAVPGKPLGKGEAWTGEGTSPLSDGIIYKRTDRGTVAGTEDGLTKLEVETDNAMTGGPKGGGLTLDLKGDKGKRTVLFDPKAGRVRKVTEEYTVSGSINIGGGGGGGGAPPNLTLNLSMKATVTVSDELPKGEK